MGAVMIGGADRADNASDRPLVIQLADRAAKTADVSVVGQAYALSADAVDRAACQIR